MRLLPGLEPLQELDSSFLDIRALQPRLDRFRFERDQHALPAVLHGRNPGRFAGQRSSSDTKIQFPVHLGHGGFNLVNPTCATTSRRRWTSTIRWILALGPPFPASGKVRA